MSKSTSIIWILVLLLFIFGYAVFRLSLNDRLNSVCQNKYGTEYKFSALNDSCVNQIDGTIKGI